MFAHSRFYLIVLLFALLGTACQREPQVVRITAVPPEPTVIAVQPTATATATVTATPTAVPTPLPTATAVPDTLEAFPDREQNWDNFPLDGSLTVRFNQPMAPESEAEPLQFTPHVAGSFVWSDDNTAVTFTPEGKFRPGARYRVAVVPQLRSLDGKQFRVADAPRWTLLSYTPPRVVSFTPDERILTELAVQPEIKFSTPMNRASVAEALTIEPAVPYELVWLADDLVQIALTEWLVPGESYAFVVDDTAVSLTDEPLTPYEYQFSSRPLYTIQRRPQSNQPGLAGNIRLSFNYDIDGEQLRQQLTLSPTLPISSSWDAATNVLTILPSDGRWPGNTPLHISLNEPPQLQGTPLSVPVAVEIPPLLPILSVFPQGDVLLTNRVEVVFDRLMDEEATAVAFHITPPVSGTIRWEETALIFEPDAPLGQETRYTVQVDSSALDAQGNPLLADDLIWTFRTGQFTDMASFGYGPNIQAITLDGRRAVHYALQSNRVGLEIPIELYRLDTPQFLDRYSSGFRGVNQWQKQAISFTDLELAAQWTTTTTEAITPYANAQELIVPADVPPGFYLLNLGDKNVLNDQLLLVVTPYTLLSKYVGNQILNWVTDAQGNPVAGVDVGLYSRDGERVGGGVTDENGVYAFEIGLRDPAPLLAIVQAGQNVAATGFTHEWKESGPGSWWQPNFGLNPDPYAVYLYTDRPLYKPGQTVYYKGIVRLDDDALLSLPDIDNENTAVTLRIRDARNNVVRTTAETLNEFGMFHGEFALADGAMLGDYKLEIEMLATDDRAAYRAEQLFKVEDYRKPDYQIELELSDTALVAGGTLSVTGEVSYFFGEPLADTAVSVELFRVDEYWQWDTGETVRVWYEANTPPLNVTTDAHGRFEFAFETEFPDWGTQWYDWRTNLKSATYAVQVSATDESELPVSSFRSYTVYSADTKLRLDMAGYVHQPGEPIGLTATAVSLYDQPRPNQELTLSVSRYSPTTGDYTDVRQEVALQTTANGQADVQLVIEDSGYYRLRLAGQDGLGNDIYFDSWIYVFARDFSTWWGRSAASSSGQLSLSVDRESYAPGDVAQIMVETTLDGPALLAVERGQVRDEQLVQLTSPVTILELPIQPEYAPNIFVSLSAWDENETTITEDMWYSAADLRLHTAVVELKVPATDKQLQVEIIADREIYAPRQEATFTLRVTNARGEPVSAEFSLAVVDEAIFALSNDLAGSIYDAFYYDRDNLVRTYHAFKPQRELGGGGHGGGGGDGGNFGNPRSDFPDTAAWFHTLRTDASGLVTVTMPLPDNLTSWRLTARGATADTQVGEATHNVIVRQDVIVRPLLPRILTTGDTVLLSAVVQNFGDEPVTLDVWLDVAEESYLQVERPAEAMLYTLQPGETRVIGWPTTAVGAGLATITVAASQEGQVVDAVQLPLPIQPRAMPDVATQVGDFRARTVLTVDMPPTALPQSYVQLELSRSLAGTMLAGLDYLTGFPYGCVEQTMSRALPNAVVGRAFNQLGIADPTLMADLPPKINASIQRLYGFQHNDGGWGWWYDDASDHYQTAWVIFGLLNTAEAGYEVDPNVILRGVEWLGEELPRMDRRTRAYVLYTMSLAFTDEALRDSQPSLADLVRRNLLEMSEQEPEVLVELGTFTIASLALGLEAVDEWDAAQRMLGLLVDTAVVNPETGLVHWRSGTGDGYYDRKVMASDLRSTAHALSAFSRLAPGHALEAGIVRYLLNNRRQNGWGTTNETAFAIIALTDHLLVTDFADDTPTSYIVSLNGREVATGQLARGNPHATVRLPVNDAWQVGENVLTIQQSGLGRLYYTLNRTAYVPEEAIEAAGVIGLERTYRTLAGEVITNTAVGELVEVTLHITADDPVPFVIVEDLLPGGFEALNERLNNTAHVATHAFDPNRRWYQEYGYNYKEVRSDRVSFFITDLPEGRTTITYLMRAIRPGAFIALPATVSAMYDVTQWGHSASATLTVLP